MTARETFGDEYVESRIGLRQRMLEERQAQSDASEVPASTDEKQQKLLAALTTMGFKKAESRKAVAQLATDAAALPMDQLIRRALGLLEPG